MTQWGLDSLFNPAKRHMDEEKQRLQSTREEVGDSSGGKRIDLSSGKVIIERADDEAEPAEVDDTNVDDTKVAESKNAEPEGEPQTAAERARMRHRNRRAADQS